MLCQIVLWAEDFKADVWEEYCRIAGATPDAESIGITFDDNLVKVTYPNVQEDDE